MCNKKLIFNKRVTGATTKKEWTQEGGVVAAAAPHS